MSDELNNTELLSQISQMLDRQTKEMQRQMQVQTEEMQRQMQAQTEKMQKQMQTNANLLKERIDQAETRMNVKLENEVTKRIDSLFDGYKLNHEKQWELERKLERLEHRVDNIENRIA